jgi:hypothetical protein
MGQLWTFLAVALPVLASLLVPMPAVDLAYQLRAGADILAGHGIPTADAWTFTVTGTPWLDQQWGAQIVLTADFKAAGWTGLAILRAALVGLTFGLLLATVRSAWSIASTRAGGSAIASSARTATLLVLAFFAVGAPALALRPQLFGIVLFAATLLILVERSRHPRRLWLIPVFAVAWANLHGSFPLVIVLVALAWVDEVTLLRTPAPAGHARARLSRRLLGSTGLAIIAAISALATLVTPFGLDAWRYIERLARDPEITSQVTEWRPPSPLDPAGAIFYLSLVAAVVMLGFRFRSDRGRPPAQFVAAILALVVFGALGAVTGRGLAWWVLVAPVAIVSLQPGLRLADVRLRGLPQLRARTAREASISEARRTPLNAWVMAVLVLAGVVLLPPLRDEGPAGVPRGVLSFAPQGVAEALRELRDRGTIPSAARVWNPQQWGSWLEYAVPDLRYAVDSRIELFAPELWADVHAVAPGVPGWEVVLANHRVDVTVIRSDDLDLASAFVESTTWVQCYADDDGSIFIPVAGRGSASPSC